MKSLIQKLLYVSEWKELRECPSAEEEAASSDFLECDEKLRKLLPDSLLDLYIKTLDTSNGCHSEEVDRIFALGFKLGLRIGMEAAE